VRSLHAGREGADSDGRAGAGQGTPFDFRKATAIGARIDAANDQIALGGGSTTISSSTGWRARSAPQRTSSIRQAAERWM
jgi:hypothetical protein